MASNVIELRLDPTQAVNEQSQQAALALSMAQAYEVIDSEDVCGMASTELRQIVTKKKQLNDARLLITRPMDEAKQQVMALFSPALERLEEAEMFLKGRINGFLEDQERRRRVEEARQADLRRQEQERIAAAAAEERARAEAEAQTKLNAAKDAIAAGNTEAASLATAAADAILQEGEENARALQEQAAVLPAPIVAETKVKGITRSKKWKAELTSKADLIKHVAAHPEYLNLLDVNMVAANQLAKAQQDAMNIPGLRAVPDHVIGSRAA